MIIKILLDECLPKKLKYRIEELDPDFFVNTVPEMGWAGAKDGTLLTKAEKDFDVFITSDRNLSFQQSIEDTEIQVLLLIASTNIYEDLLPLVEKLEPVIKDYESGQFRKIK
jgi:predicted nuclease of predicted toxin-antitoxin system